MKALLSPFTSKTFDAEIQQEKTTSQFGSDVPLKRAGKPSEVAPCYVFPASGDASYIRGQVLHPNGGESVNG